MFKRVLNAPLCCYTAFNVGFKLLFGYWVVAHFDCLHYDQGKQQQRSLSDESSNHCEISSVCLS